MDYKAIVELVHSCDKLIANEENAHKVQQKGRADFVTAVDVAVQEYLRKELALLYPQVIMLSEEQERLTVEEGKAYWILDPIDGTQNFIRGTGMSAVSLGYYNGKKLEFGVVYNPFNKETFTGIKGQGAFLNGLPIRVTANSTLEASLICMGTSPYDRQYSAINFPLFQEVFDSCLDLRRSGSAALDLCYVAAGRYDGYFERNLKPWDMAAGTLILQEAGGLVTDYRGNPPIIGANLDTVATNGIINAELLALIQKHWQL